MQLADQAAPDAAGGAIVADIAWVRSRHLLRAGRLDEARAVQFAAAASSAAEYPATAASVFFRTAAALYNAGDTAGVTNVAARLGALDLPDREDTRPYVRATAGLASLVAGDPATGIPAVREVLDHAYESARIGPTDRLTLAGEALIVGDLRASFAFSDDVVRACREGGGYARLPQALAAYARAQYLTGQHVEARAACDEGLNLGREIADGGSVGMLHSIQAQLLAIHGDELGCREVGGILTGSSNATVALTGLRALSLLDLGHRRYEAALSRFTQIAAGRARFSIPALYGLPDHVEAAARIGRADLARVPLRRYLRWAEATGQCWAAAIGLRLRALLAQSRRRWPCWSRLWTGTQPATGAASSTPAPPCSTASGYAAPDGLPTPASSCASRWRRWNASARGRGADRARDELRAAGVSVAVPAASASVGRLLTAQELQVARLAATGLSNVEIGERLLLSPRTVGYHLYKIYPKLGIRSRTELAGLDLND